MHEVYIDDEQVAWFEALLRAHPDTPVIVFTHAPPLGSGLKVVQEVHVKNRCAWLNHSDRPKRFIELVQKHDNVRLWFSGHFHLVSCACGMHEECICSHGAGEGRHLDLG